VSAVWAGGWIFAALAVVAGGIMCWEWVALARESAPDTWFAAHAACVVLAGGLAAFGQPLFAIVLIAILGLVALILDLHRPLTAVGFAYVGLPVVALIWLRADDSLGLWALILVLAVVWATDIAAYFTGRLVGGARLAPRISPGKTWSGLAGGVLGAIVAGYGIAALVPGSEPWRLAAIGGLGAIISQLGDLTESALKRRAGLKDAGHLIPGHGGVLDRVDGLVFAAVAAALYGFLIRAGAPAHALLFG
jgi:phosphatidate cytidylyltransferase